VHYNLAVKKKLLSILFLATFSVFGQISVGIRIGPPPPPRVVRVRPAAPGPGFIWVDGYWFAAGNRYRWHDGYWTRPPYEGAVWVAPHHDGERFFDGYWEGPHGRVPHDHKWDKEHDRDFRHEHHDDHDHH
jgi:YXWGXW repeat-containing protein